MNIALQLKLFLAASLLNALTFVPCAFSSEGVFVSGEDFQTTNLPALPTTSTVVTVGPVAFDPVASGQALRDAVDSILDASSSRRYLIRLDPGIYDVRSAMQGHSLVMKPWVSLEGSGETVTEIRSGGSATNLEGTIETADNSEVRRLTVRNTGGARVAVAILVTSGPSALDHVTAIASGATDLNYGIRHTGGGTEVRHFDVTAQASGGTTAYGVTVREVDQVTFVRLKTRASGASDSVGLLIFDEVGFGMKVLLDTMTAEASGSVVSSAVRIVGGATVDIRRSRFLASGGSENFGLETSGLTSTSVRLSIEDSTIIASGGQSYGIFNESGIEVRVDRSRVGGGTSALLDDTGGGAQFLVGATQLTGGPVSGSFRCAFVYDEDYMPLSSDCSGP